MTGFDIAWLAGLLEGEGSFLMHQKQKTLRIQVQMTDRDVLERVAKIAGVQAKVRPHKLRPGRKQVYHVYVTGRRAAGWMMTLWPLMGQRRRAKIAECLAVWRAWRDTRFGPITEARRRACSEGQRRRFQRLRTATA